MSIFENREEAGKLLAKKLEKFKNDPNVLVFGITRGGVVAAKAIAEKLNLPLDIIVIKKIGAPRNSELAIGAVGPKGSVYWDKELISRLGISDSIKSELRREKVREQKEKEKILRNGRKGLQVKEKTVILIDDGVATGSTVLCALDYFKKEKAKKVILATPVIPEDTLNNIAKYFDTVIVLSAEKNFMAVGQFYKEFLQVSDQEVINIISKRTI